MADKSKLTADVLRDPEYADYVSDAPFNPEYIDEPMRKDFDNVVVIDGFPEVPADKYERLLNPITTLLTKQANGQIIDISMPQDEETKASKGFVFVEYTSAEIARSARDILDGKPFTAANKMKAYMYSDMKRALNEPEDESWMPHPVVDRASEDMYTWLLDAASRDAFAIGWVSQVGRRVQEVMWCDGKRAPALHYAGDADYTTIPHTAWVNAAEFRWSPQGTYLATLSTKGVRMWSGSRFDYGQGFQHAGCNEVVFSPDERYLLTWSGYRKNPAPANAIIIWDMLTSEQLKTFKQREEDDEPDMKWSHDGKYIARLEKDVKAKIELIKVYEAPSFGLLGGASIKAVGAAAFEWNPAGGSLAWWTPERENQGTSVDVVSIPSKEVVRHRTLFNIERVELIWHPDGTYLAIVAHKAKKQKKGKGEKKDILPSAVGAPAGCTIEILRVKEKGIPVDTLEIKERVKGLSWEPNGSRFAVITGDGPNQYNMTFYNAEKLASPLITLENKNANSVVWSPRGVYCVLAGKANLAGRYEFYDVDRLKSFGTAEHPKATEGKWDPSGRVFASYKHSPMSGASYADMVGNGYQLYTFQGTRFFEVAKPQLLQFAWRPRPATLLTDEEIRWVNKSLKDEFIPRFLAEDNRATERRRMIERLRLRKERDEFRSRIAKRHEHWTAMKGERQRLKLEEPPIATKLFEETVDIVVEEIVEEVK